MQCVIFNFLFIYFFILISDDDVDQIDDADQNEKHVDEKVKQHPEQFRLRVPVEKNLDSVMVQPK